MEHNIWIYILISAGVSYLIRSTPLLLIRKEITNKTIRSFLYYVPYATLAVMTFPAIVHATQSPVSGIAALVVGLITAWCNFGLFKVAASCCITVLLMELILI